RIRATAGTWSSNWWIVTFTPAVQVSQGGYTRQQPITEATRGYVYVDVLNPLPAPGTTIVSYRANGRWYDLKDDGSGTLVGADGTGAGTIAFDSGALVATLGALPDIGSSFVEAWGAPAQYDIRTTDVNIQIPAISLTLTASAKPSTVSITWVVGMTTKTVTDNGSGVLSGDGTGNIDYPSGIITLHPTSLPNPVTGIAVAYENNPVTVQNLTPSKSGSTISFTLSNAPIAPKSILIEYGLTAPATYPFLFGGNPNIARVIHDDGAGGLVDSVFGAIVGASVNYTTGLVSFNPDLTSYHSTTQNYLTYQAPIWNPSATPPQYVNQTVTYTAGWNYAVVTAPFVNGSAVTVSSTAASASSASQTDNFPAPSIILDLTPQTVEPIVPGGVMFAFAGDTYVDHAGILYRSISHTTNSGTSAGTLDYTTGKAIITDWVPGGAQTLSIKALLCEFGVTPIGFLSARVPGNSIRPASFIIQANRKTDDALITATADSNGDWSTGDMTGHIDTDTGFFTVAFGALVLDSSLTTPQKAEPWYNSGNVDGTGHIWYPNEALAGTIRYSCVVQTYLPLSAGVLGIDPVRLPQDGRVQIFRPGNTLVFRNPLTFTFGGTVAGGDTTSLPRGALESAVLYDTNGVQVDIGLYTSDLSAGSITIVAMADLSAYTQPFVCTHTRGELALCTDAQITGQVSITGGATGGGLVNDYPAASSYVSSALIADNSGNLQADYDTKFQQTTWNFNPNALWQDVVQGSSPTSVYDDVDYPIEVLDRDCITQRVALIFTSSIGGNIAFEELGIIGTFTTSADVAPINPATSGETAVTSGSFVIAAVGMSQTVNVVSAAGLDLYDRIAISDGTHSMIGTITAIAGTALTVLTSAITAGSAGNTMATAANITVANPFFFMDHRGFGSGWASGNAIRFNLRGAGFPIWFARSVQVGAAETMDDHFSVEIRHDE
ncbi:MAG: hypothetical protein ACREPT_14260, partial [Rudaea sp.]